MANQTRTVVNILGSVLDAPLDKARWSTWRPTVGLCCHEDLVIDRMLLLYDKKHQAILDTVCADIASVSPETEVVAIEMCWQDAWDFEEVYGKLHRFARRQSFARESEELLIGITTGTHVAQICLYLLTESRHLPGKLLQLSPPKRGRGRGPSTDEHIGSYEIIDLDLSRYDALASRFELEQAESLSFLKSGISTRNAGFNQLIESIEKVAVNSAQPILLTGPTGSGKSHLANRIYELKKLRNQIDGPMVSVNCATLVGDHAMSTLFGHVKGAFTGASTAREGLLRAADGGMLFLDEVGELGTDEQAMLLKAVEEKRFLPLGSDREVESNFQLIAGTNQNLKSAVSTGRFRADLLARIDLWTFALPGLAQRREDIEANLEYELKRYTDQTGNKIRFAPRAKTQFLKFAQSDEATWDANFRDLNAAVARMGTLCSAGKISSAVVADECERLALSWQVPTVDTHHDLKLDSIADRLLGSQWTQEHDLFDQQQIVEVLRVCRGSKSLAAAGRVLFGVSRAIKKNPNDSDRLRKYLAKLGLSFDKIQQTARD